MSLASLEARLSGRPTLSQSEQEENPLECAESTVAILTGDGQRPAEEIFLCALCVKRGKCHKSGLCPDYTFNQALDPRRVANDIDEHLTGSSTVFE
jgi:hypothetical protein